MVLGRLRLRNSLQQRAARIDQISVEFKHRPGGPRDATRTMMTTETQTNAAEVQPKRMPNRLRIVGDGTMGGTRIEDVTTGEMIRFVRSYTVTQHKDELAHAFVEVLLPEINLECDATIVKVAGNIAPDQRPKPAPAAPNTGETSQNKQSIYLSPHELRVVYEKADLDDRRGKLNQFFATPIFAGLSESEQSRLRRQFVAMSDYSAILGERLAAFSAEAMLAFEREQPTHTPHPALAAMTPIAS